MTLLPFVRLGSNMEFISNLPISVSQTRLKRRKRKHARILWTGSSHSSFLYILHPSSRSFFPFLKCFSAVLLKFFPTQLADIVWLNQCQFQAYLGESKVIQMHKEIMVEMKTLALVRHKISLQVWKLQQPAISDATCIIFRWHKPPIQQSLMMFWWCGVSVKIEKTSKRKCADHVGEAEIQWAQINHMWKN